MCIRDRSTSLRTRCPESAKLSKYSTCCAMVFHVVRRFRFCLSNLFKQDTIRLSKSPNCLSRKALKSRPPTHEPLGSLAKGKLPLCIHCLGGSQHQQALHYQDDDQAAIDEATDAFWPGAFGH